MSWDWLSALWDAPQRRHLKQGFNSANQYIDTGYNDAMKYKNQAYGLYDPMVQQGRQAYDLYTNALGLGGVDKARQATNTIYNNPIFNDMNNMAQDETRRYLNSRGDAAGGNAQLASQMALQKNLQNYLGMYRDLGNRGDNAINNQANIRLGQADLAYGYGGTKAGLANNYYNARAERDSVPLNNFINLGTKVASAATGMPSMGGNIGQPAYSQAGTQANGGWSTNAYANNQSSNNLLRWFS